MYYKTHYLVEAHLLSFAIKFSIAEGLSSGHVLNVGRAILADTFQRGL